MSVALVAQVITGGVVFLAGFWWRGVLDRRTARRLLRERGDG